MVNDFHSDIEKEANLSELTPEISTTKLFNKDDPLITTENKIENSKFDDVCNENNMSSLDQDKTENINND